MAIHFSSCLLEICFWGEDMNVKQLLSFITLSMGIILLIFIFHGTGSVHGKYLPVITHSPVSPTERIPSDIETHHTDLEASLRFWLTVGYVLILVGGISAIRHREK
jgi:hypothetical protein